MKYYFLFVVNKNLTFSKLYIFIISHGKILWKIEYNFVHFSIAIKQEKPYPYITYFYKNVLRFLNVSIVI